MDDRGDQRVRARLVDVLPLTFAALAAVKAVDVHLDFGAWLAVAWVAACCATVVHRSGWAALSLLAFVLWAAGDGEMVSNHTILIALVAGILAVGVEAERLLWTQTVALYLFAALNKLNPDYFDGSGIAERSPHIPFPALLALGGVAIEAWLVWAVCRRHRWALPVAIVLHVGIVASMSTRPYQLLLLASFNGAMVLLVWFVTRRARPLLPDSASC